MAFPFSLTTESLQKIRCFRMPLILKRINSTTKLIIIQRSNFFFLSYWLVDSEVEARRPCLSDHLMTTSCEKIHKIWTVFVTFQHWQLRSLRFSTNKIWHWSGMKNPWYSHPKIQDRPQNNHKLLLSRFIWWKSRLPTLFFVARASADGFSFIRKFLPFLVFNHAVKAEMS